MAALGPGQLVRKGLLEIGETGARQIVVSASARIIASRYPNVGEIQSSFKFIQRIEHAPLHPSTDKQRLPGHMPR